MTVLYVCSKCGYIGPDIMHGECGHAAVPLNAVEAMPRCETVACIVFAAIDNNRASSVAQAWAAAVAAADQIEAVPGRQ